MAGVPMPNPVLGPDRVLLLLALVPYLREHGAVSVTELAATFDVTPKLLRELVRFLGTAGVPGETMSYQHEDLFDIDWDALERFDEVSLTRTVAVEEAPRFAPAETAALVAGLHALTAVLPPQDAELARATAAKLGAALGAGATPAVSVSVDPEDPRIPVLVTAIDTQRSVRFVYRDASGVETQRTVDPVALTQGGGGWYLRAFCLDRNAERTFRVDQIAELTLSELSRTVRTTQSLGSPPRASDPDPEAGPKSRVTPAPVSVAPVTGITLRVTSRALPRLSGFAPEIVSESADGGVIVRVDAWHRDTAINLVQLAPGEISIESPAAAREAVRVWAERALAAYGE